MVEKVRINWVKMLLYYQDAVIENCVNGQGTCCGEYIRRSGWQIPNNYPW